MGDDDTLRALVAKRPELLNDLERRESAIRSVRDDLAHLDVTIPRNGPYPPRRAPERRQAVHH